MKDTKIQAAAKAIINHCSTIVATFTNISKIIGTFSEEETMILFAEVTKQPQGTGLLKVLQCLETPPDNIMILGGTYEEKMNTLALAVCSLKPVDIGYIGKLMNKAQHKRNVAKIHEIKKV